MSFLRACREFLSSASAPLRPSSASASASAGSVSTASDDPHANDLAPSSFTLYQVLGFPECPWFHRAACIASDAKLARQGHEEEQVEVSILPSPRAEFAGKLDLLAELFPESASHNSCPAIVSTTCRRTSAQGTVLSQAEFACDDMKFVGGYTELERLLQQRYAFKSERCEALSVMTGNGAAGCPPPPQPKRS